MTGIVSGSYAHAKLSGSTGVQLLLSGSVGRRQGMIFNHSSNALYIGPYTDVSAEKFMVKLTSGTYYEMPAPPYDGPLYGKMDGASGYVMITDFTSSE